MNERNRGTMMDVPIETSPDASGRNAVNVPVTSTTPIVTEAETTEAETRSPRTFLPDGSPSRPLRQPPVDHEQGCNVFQRDK